MAIDEALTRKLQEHINAKWQRGCPMCGAKAWALSGFTTALGVTDNIPKGAILGAPFLPTAVLVCSNCGNTVLVNAIVAGLAAPQDV